jgi:hypothetical protein
VRFFLSDLRFAASEHTRLNEEDCHGHGKGPVGIVNVDYFGGITIRLEDLDGRFLDVAWVM